MEKRVLRDTYIKRGTFRHAGAVYHVFQSTWSDGRSFLYFATKNNAAKSNLHNADWPRISFHIHPDSVVLSGILVPERYGGTNMGEALTIYFRDFTKKHGLKFEVTSHINKPTIARTLVRSGFTPVSTNLQVEILPRPKGDGSRIPSVQVVKNADRARLVTHSPDKTNEFFRVVPAVVAKRYPIPSPDSRVAIQTRYVPPQE